MSFLKFIILLMILGWIVGPLIKKIVGTGKSQGQGQKKGLAGKLSDFIAEVQQDIEKAAASQQTGTDAQNMELPDLDPEESLWDAYRDPESPTPKTRAQSSAPAPTSSLKNSAKKPELQPAGPPVAELATAGQPPPNKPYDSNDYYKTNIHKATYNRKQLKKAVIWSEIIAPPVSMRDNHLK